MDRVRWQWERHNILFHAGSFLNQKGFVMKKKPIYTGPVSITLRRHPHGNSAEILSTIYWVAMTSLFLFLALIITNLLAEDYRDALAIAIGLIPILTSIWFLRKNAISVPSTILAVTIILLITWLATFGAGVHDIGLLGFPVIL